MFHYTTSGPTYHKLRNTVEAIGSVLCISLWNNYSTFIKMKNYMNLEKVEFLTKQTC